MPKTRYDSSTITVTKTDEGFLIDSPIVARTGILIYRNDDGSTRRELRLPEDVFHPDSLASYKGKPITVDHPGKAVDKKNVALHSVGTVLDKGRADGANVNVITDIVIHQPDKIGERRQLSLGYNVDLDETPGVWNGEKYDAIQRNIRVNHLSVVKSARAGAIARLNMDSNEILEIENELELPKMPKIRLDSGIEYEAPAEVVAAMEKMRIDSAQVETQLKTQTTLATTLASERDTLKARVDGFPAEIKTATEKATAEATIAVQNRAKLVDTAKAFKVDAKDKTDDEIRHAVIKTFNKDFDPKDKSPEYVNVAFDIAVSSRNDAAISSQRQIVNSLPNRNDVKDELDPAEVYKRSLGSNGVVAKQ